MPSVNRVILAGHITRGPDAKQTQSGTQSASFGLADNARRPDGQGGYREEVSFIDCVCFGKRAEALLKWFHKGDPILVEGRLNQDRWEDKSTGDKRSRVKVLVDSWHFIGAKTAKEGGGESREAAKPAGDDFNPDDVPF